MANTRGGDYQFSVVEKDQADTYLLIMKNVSAFSQLDCHLPPTPLLSKQKKQIQLFFEKSICASASALGISNRRTFEKHDKFQMYHKTTILCIETYAAVNEIKF